MRTFFRLLRPFVLKTNSCWLFGKFYQKIYLLALKIFVHRIKRFSEIDSIYLRESLTTRDWVPGDSDIDLTIILKDLDPQAEVEFLSRFWKTSWTFEQVFPFIRKQDIALLSAKEMLRQDLVQRYFPRIPSSSVYRWKLLYGKEYRKEWKEFREDPPQEILVDYRIKSFYDILFSQLYNAVRKRKMFLRQCYRGITKILHLIYFALNNSLPPSEIELFDYFTKHDASPSRELVAELLHLKQAGYWSKQPFEVMSRCTLGVMRTLDDFYKGLLKKSDSYPEEINFETQNFDPLENSGSSVFQELNGFLKKILQANSCLHSIFLISDHDANLHELYLILNEDCDFNSFQKTVRLIQEELVNLKKLRVDLSVMTENILKGEIYFLGGYSATYYFYLMRHGKVLYGKDIKETLKKPPTPSILHKFDELSSVVVPIYFRSMLANHSCDFNQWEIYDLLNYRLLKEKGVLSVSVHETWKEYRKHYGEEKETSWFVVFHHGMLKGNVNFRNRQDLYLFARHLLKKLEYLKNRGPVVYADFSLPAIRHLPFS